MPVTRDAKGRAEYWCEGCGQMAHFGDGPARWYCGWKDWRPWCAAVAKKAATPGLADLLPSPSRPVSPPAASEAAGAVANGGRIPPGDAPVMRAAVAERRPPPASRKRVTHVPAGQGSLF